MDELTGTALYQEKVTQSPEALAIEVVTLRAWFGSLGVAMDKLTAQIAQTSRASNDPMAMARCAGGIAAVQLLNEWAQDSMGTINDFIVTMSVDQ